VAKTSLQSESKLVIQAPRIEKVRLKLLGTAPYVQLRFSEKAINTMRLKHEAGSQAKKSTKKEARDFDEDFQQALHVSTEGWYGIPASAFRNAMISACRLVGFKMTLAKLSVFVESDGFDRVDSIPLVKIHGEPEPSVMHVRNATGVCDLRVRGKYFPWTVDLDVVYDCDQFSAQDVYNLMLRVGMQVGIGEGRHDGKQSAGMGWGTFAVDGNIAVTKV